MTALPVTLLIPTRNRPAYLERCLQFYKPYVAELEIIVLDSSDTNESQVLCDGFQQVSYVHYPADISFADKLAQGSLSAGSDFITVCSDDDFIFAEGIAACATFLDENPDYVCAHGKYLRHWFDDDGKLQFYETYLGNHANMLDAALPASERLQCHFTDYTPTFYGVTRKTVFTDAYQTTARLNVEFGLSEVLPSALMVLAGKITRIPVMYASRESHRHNWVTEDRLQQMYSAEKIASTLAELQSRLPVNEHALLSQLLAVGKGMISVPLSDTALAIRQQKSRTDFADMKITQEEAGWAVNHIAEILLNNQGYSRQEMIKLRESLYLT